jgi:outer membrane protein OmpA-like peptidoglycan-associated protein
MMAYKNILKESVVMTNKKLSTKRSLPFLLVLGAALSAPVSSSEIGPLLNADDGEYSLGLGYYSMRTSGLEYDGGGSTGVTDLIEQDAYFMRLRYQFVDDWSVSMSYAADRLKNEPTKTIISHLDTGRQGAWGLSVEGAAYKNESLSLGPFLQYTMYSDMNISGRVSTNNNAIGSTLDAKADNFYSLRAGAILQNTYEYAKAYSALYYYQSEMDVKGTLGLQDFDGKMIDDNKLGFALGLNLPVSDNFSFNVEGHYRHEPGVVFSFNYQPGKKARAQPEPEIRTVEKVVVVEKVAEPKPAAAGTQEYEATLLFEKNAVDVTPSELPKIKALADFLADDDKAMAFVEGHCDCDGPDATNDKLSEDRANAVKKVLVDYHGIAENRVVIEGYGEKFPIATNDTEEGRQLNRRVRIFAYK